MKNIEKYYPIAVSAVVAAAALCLRKWITDIPAFVDKLDENALVIAVTFVGFLLTILTIINSIETRRMKFVKEAGEYPELLNYLNKAIKGNLYLVGFSFIVKFIEYRKIGFLNIWTINIVDYLYVFYFCFALLLSYRFTSIFVKLLSDPGEVHIKK